jgi:hypothetical protein
MLKRQHRQSSFYIAIGVTNGQLLYIRITDPRNIAYTVGAFRPIGR